MFFKMIISETLIFINIFRFFKKLEYNNNSVSMKNNEFYCFYFFYCFILYELQSLYYFTIYYLIVITFYFCQITIAFDAI